MKYVVNHEMIGTFFLRKFIAVDASVIDLSNIKNSLNYSKGYEFNELMHKIA